jgi:hypothetical protein
LDQAGCGRQTSPAAKVITVTNRPAALIDICSARFIPLTHSYSKLSRSTQSRAVAQMFVCWWTIGYINASVQKISAGISSMKW